MNAIGDCVEALADGGSPAAWQRTRGSATAGVHRVDACVEAACALAVVPPPELLRGPLLGTTLAEVTGCVPQSGARPDTKGWDGQRRQREHATPDHDEVASARARMRRQRDDDAAPPERHVPGGRTVRRRGPDPHVHQRDPAPWRPRAHAVHEAVPPSECRVDTGRLRQWAGDVPAPVDVRRPSKARLQPPAARRRHRGEGARTAPREQYPQDPHHVHALPPRWVSEQDRRSGDRRARSAQPAVTQGLPPRHIPRPGPAAPAELLHRHAFGSPERSTPPAARADDAPTRGRVARAAGAGPGQRRTDEPRGLHDGPLDAVAPVQPDIGETDVRASSYFAERSTLPGGGRVVAPGPGGDLASYPPTSGASTTARHVPAPAPSEAEVERLMRRILDDAARRHGIEV